MKAEEFIKMKVGIYPMDSNELILDCTANKTDLRKINLSELMEQYAEGKIKELRADVYYQIDQRVNHISTLGKGYGINDRRVVELKWCKAIIEN